MTVITIKNDMDVELVQSMGTDMTIIRAAKVSTKGAGDIGAMTTEAVERFLSFLIKNRHHSPLEHVVFTFRVRAPIFVWREFMRHRHACVTGDTVITFCGPSGKDRQYQSIETFYDNWTNGVPDSRVRSGRTPRYRKRYRDWVVEVTVIENGKRTTSVLGPFSSEDEARQASGRGAPWRRRILPSVRNKRAISIDESTGQGVPNKVLDVVQSGVKKVYELTTVDGDRIKVSEDHRFRTDNGYVPLKDLRVGGHVQVNGARGCKVVKDPLVGSHLRAGIGSWVTRVRNEMDKNALYSCYICSTTLTWKDMEMDHVKPVVTHLELALTESNLKPACSTCHRTKTSLEQKHRRSGSTVQWGAVNVEIASIEYAGEEMTYDITMEAPNNNFLANNIVVHNSYSEESGRYKVLDPVFYVPAGDRPVVQVGKVGEYRFEDDAALNEAVQEDLGYGFQVAWDLYESMINEGVAREVARMVLPVSVYSSAYVTMNLRSLMNFLSLRTKHPDATVPSFPMQEIAMVADQIETILMSRLPVTMRVWHELGRNPA